MKKVILLTAAASFLWLNTKAQCGEVKVRYTSSKMDHLGSDYKVTKSDDANVTVNITKTDIVLIPEENPSDSLSGKIDKSDCNWKEAFKNGKSVLKGTLTNPAGKSYTATVTIEAIDGKITMLFEATEEPDDKLKLTVDKYEVDPKS